MKAKFTVKYIVCAVILCFAALCAGCGARVDVYEETTDGKLNLSIDVRLSAQLDEDLNGSAKINEKTGRKWSFGSWLNAYVNELSQLYGFKYVYPGVMQDTQTGEKVYRISKIELGSSEYLDSALSLSGDATTSTNLFFITVNVERDDRFNYFISEYEDAYRHLLNGESLSGEETVCGIFLFGIRNVYPAYENQPNHPDIAGDPAYKYDSETGEVYKTVLPAFSDVFGVDPSDYKKLKLRDFWHTAYKMAAECTSTKTETINGESKFYFVFEKSAGDGSTKVRYRYLRADPTGWYIVALLGGGITVLIVVLAAKSRRKRNNEPPKQSIRSNFPYDPFDGNIDPFE